MEIQIVLNFHPKISAIYGTVYVLLMRKYQLIYHSFFVTTLVSDDLKAIWPGLSFTVINLLLAGAVVPVWTTARLNLSN